MASKSFGLLSTVTLDDQVDAQPLVVPGVEITAGSSQRMHDVVYVATESNTVYAIDVHSGAILVNSKFGWHDIYLQRQRPALLLANGAVYASFGSFCDFSANLSRGWLLGWSARTLVLLAGHFLPLLDLDVRLRTCGR